MTIRLGTATLQGTELQLQAPGRTNTFTALRLTNYTAEVFVLNNISSVQMGEEYLFPLQQMVYRVENVSAVATITGASLGIFTSVPAVYAEWSDDPLTDFPGTYPTSVTANPIAIHLSITTLALTTAATTYSVPANPNRTALTIINASGGALPDGRIQWSSDDASWTTAPFLARGVGRVVNATSPVYFRGVDALSAVEIDEETR